MLNFPDNPTVGQEFVATPKAAFTWTAAPDRWRRKIAAPVDPMATALLPDNGLVNTAIPVSIFGQGFIPTAEVYLVGGVKPAVTFVSSTELRITMPSTPTHGAVKVWVYHPGDPTYLPPVDGLDFTYNPIPLVLTSLNPGAVIQGTLSGMGPNVTLNGSGFNPNCWAMVNGVLNQTTYVSPTQLTALAVEDRTVGTFPIKVRDQSTMLESNVLDWYVTSNQPPNLISVSPNSVVQGTTISLLTVTGVNFVNGKRIVLDGKPVTTTYVNATTLTTTNVATAYGAPYIKVTVEDCPGEVRVTLTSTSFLITAGPTPSSWRYGNLGHPYVGDNRFWLNRNVGDNNQCKVILTHQDTGERFEFGTYADFQGDPTSSWFSPGYVKPVPPNQWFWFTVEIGGVSSANREAFTLV